jgi:hypothetical protein
LNGSTVAALYERHVDPGIEPLPAGDALSDSKAGHTMGAKLKDYILTKLSEEQRFALVEAKRQGWRIRVIGAYSGHEPIWLEKLSETYPPPRSYTGLRCWSRSPSDTKRFNRRRPYFLVTQKTNGREFILNIVTFPSREYVQQVAGLISAAFSYGLLASGNSGGASAIPVEVVAFPDLERTVGEWSGLRTALGCIAKRDLERGVLLLGYVEELTRALGEDTPDFAKLPCAECNRQAVDRLFEIGRRTFQTSRSSSGTCVSG